MADQPTPFQSAFDRVLQRRLAASQAPVDPKRERLARAAEEKKAAMAARSGQSLTELNGFDPDSAASMPTNILARVSTTLARLGGDLAELPLDTYAGAQERGIDQPTRDAYARRQQDRRAAEAAQALQPGGPAQGQVDLRAPLPNAEPGDAERLAQRPTRPGNRLLELPESMRPDEMPAQEATAETRLDRAFAARRTAAAIDEATDLSSVVHRGREEGLREDLQDGQADVDTLVGAWDALKEGDVGKATLDATTSAAKLLVNMGDAAWDNPGAALEIIMENVPQLALASANKGASLASNLGYGLDTVREGILKYQEENEGRLPPKDELTKMYAAGIGAGLLDQVGELGSLRFLRGTRAATDTATDAGREGLKRALLRPARTLGGSAGSEGITEGGQTILEGIAGREEVTPMQVYEGSSLGAIAGGGMSSPRIGADALEAAGEGVRRAARAAEPRLAAYREQRQQRAQEKAERKAQAQSQDTEREQPVSPETREQAEESGDVSPLTDPQSEQYNPEAAMEVLVKRNATEEVSEEEKGRNETQASQLVGQVEEEVAALRDEYEATDAQHEDTVRARRQERVEQLEALPEDAPAETRADLETKIANADAILTELANAPEPTQKARKQARARLERAERRLRSLTDMQGNLVKRTLPDSEEREALVQRADSAPETEGSQEAVGEVIRLAMEAPDSLDPVAMERIAANEGNGLNPEQRTLLARFSEARKQAHAKKGTEGVSNDIFVGGRDYVGIEQYRARLVNHLKTGNMERARAQLDGIESFAQRHRNKYEAGRQALQQIEDSDGRVKRIDLVYDPARGWEPAGRFLSKQEREDAGALVVTRAPRSKALLDNIGNEAEAIEAGAQELRAMMDLNQAADRFSRAAERAGTRTTPAANQETDAPAASSSSSDSNIAIQQQGNTASQPEAPAQEESDAPTVPAEEPAGSVSEPAAEPATQSTPEPAESAPATDGAVDQSTEDTAPVSEPTAETSTPAPDTQERVSEDQAPDTEERFDPETGEVIEDVGPVEQNNDPETNGEGGLKQLRALAEGVKRASGTLKASAFKGANLVTEYVRQERGNLKRRDSKRPLVEIEAFLSQLRNDESLAQRFVSGELTAQQRELVADLADTLPGFVRTLEDSLQAWDPKRAEYAHEDYIQYYRDDETGALEENVLTAMAAAMYGWVGENNRGVYNGYNDKKAVNAILNRQSKSPVTPSEHGLLGRVGDRETMVIQDLGQRVTEALGLTVDNGVPRDLMPKLVGAFGGRAYAALQKEGLVERVEVTNAQIAEATGKPTTKGFENAVHSFVRVPLDPQANGRRFADSISDTVKGSGSLMNKLFGVRDRSQPPSLKPVPFKDRTPKRSQMAAPETLVRILADTNRQAHYVETEMASLWGQLDERVRLRVAGGVDFETQRVHKAHRIGAEAKNAALLREDQHFQEHLDTLDATGNGRLTPFYLDREMWKMQRVGLLGTQVNPQTSKVHRAMVKMGGWAHTVALDNNDGSLDEFWLAVGEALGVKTDSQVNETSIQEARDKAADPVIEAGVIAILKQRNNEPLTPADQQAIAAAAKKGGEEMHSLQGLLALAQLREADGQARFTHHLTREIDGKTNGPMLAQLLMGAANTAEELREMVVRGGFFAEGDRAEHIGEWAQRTGNLDLYQKVAKALTERASATLRKKAFNRELYDAWYFFTGELATEAGEVTKDGRNLVKTPVTALQFGSSTGTVVADMGKEVLDKVYQKIQKIDALDVDDPAREQGRQDIIRHLNKILSDRKKGVSNPIPANMPLEALMESELTKAQQETFTDKFTNTLGKDIGKTMEDVFAPFIARRKSINAAANAAFHLYDLAYRTEVQKFKRELMEAGDLSFDRPKGKGWQIHQDLTPDQEAEVRKRVEAILPVMHSAFSKHDDNLEAGLALVKRENRFDGSFTYQNRAKLPKGWGVKAPVSKGKRPMDDAPGVAAIIWGVHSSDSYIAAMSYAQLQALNVHDALVVNAGDAPKTARTLNENTFRMLTMYSPGREIAEAYGRTLEAFNTYVKDNGLAEDPAFQKRYAEKIGEINKAWDRESAMGGDILPFLQQTALSTAQQADRVKLEVLKSLTSVSQYTLENGHYPVTDADRAEIDKALEVATRKIEENTFDTARELSKIGAKAEPEPVTPDVESESAEEGLSGTSEADAQVDSSTDVARDTQEIPGSDAPVETAEAMIAELEAERGMSPKALIAVAMKGASPATRRILQRLEQHQQVAQVVVNIHDSANAHPGEYSPGTAPDSQTGERFLQPQVDINLPWLKDRAWGVRANPAGNTAGETIAEVIAHELIHAATVAAIYDTGRTGKRLNQRLQGIQGDIQAWMAANPGAVDALDSQTRHQLEVMTRKTAEIPTYGLTAKRIQEVLKRIPSRQSQGSAWTRFVKAVREALALTNTTPSVLDDILTVSDSAMRAQPDASPQAALALHMEAPSEGGPMDFSTREILEALVQRNPEMAQAQRENLENLLDQVVNGLHGPYGAYKDRARENEAVSAEDAFLTALASGQAPFVSRTRGANFKLGDAEAFVLEQVEATLRASMEHNHTNDLAREELQTVWREARASEDLKAALSEDQWAFLFRLNPDNGNRDDHLARFAAVAMVSPEVRPYMGFASKPEATNQEGRTLVQRLQDLLRKLLDLFHGRLTKTFAGQKADAKVWALMDKLVEIESRRRRQFTDQSVGWVDRVEDRVEGVTDAVRDRVVRFGKSDWVANRKLGVSRAVPKLASVVAGERTDELMNHMERVRQDMFQAKQGVVASLVSEARGAHDKATRTAHTLLRKLAKKNEQERMRLYELYRQSVLEGFSDNGRNLTDNDKEALTRTLLDADLSTLLDHGFTEEQLVGLVSDGKALNRAIQELEGQVKAGGSRWFKYHLGAARDLGWHMASGEVRSEHLMLNAHNIARMYGTRHQTKVSDSEAQAAEALLDPLISLYALQGTSHKLRQQAAEVMRREVARGNASGTATVLALHQRMKEQARDVLFEGQSVHMQKGYRAQIYNPHKSLKAVPESQLNDYVALGYVQVSRLAQDPHDVSGERKVMMVIPDGGLNRRLSGIVATTSEAMRGSPIHGGETSVAFEGRNQWNRRKNQKILAQRDAYIDGLVREGDRHSPVKGKDSSRLAPVLNPQGEVVNYRYLMKHDTKDSLLDRNNAIDDVFGAMAAHAFDKVVSKEQNRTAIEALKAQYDAEYAENPKAYVKISADAKDKQHREAFKLLPKDAKQAVREIWGGQEMWVRGDLVDINFGYQKYSLADSFKKQAEERAAIERMVTWLLPKLFGEKAYLRARQGGAIWTEIVHELKDILVVKTGLTLLGNEISNISLMLWHGVSPVEMAKHHRVAFEGILRYRRERSELDKLRLAIDTGRSSQPDQDGQRIEELTRSLERNPVAFMIDEGLMPTIVEDVDLHDDPYSYKSLLQESAEGVTGRLPKWARTAGRYAYMAHDTPLYKAMSQGTQLSDFMARYTLYQHVTTRKRQRMNHADAVQRASDMFVNYDLPSHRMVQYLNDVGLLMFTKYYIRIQRSILTLYREHPARGMLMVALNSLMPGLALLTDSQLTEKMGNPFEWGALGYPGVLDELATVKAALSPFN